MFLEASCAKLQTKKKIETIGRVQNLSKQQGNRCDKQGGRTASERSNSSSAGERA
jgi:hypothetical protein